jgi:DNA processing protein
MDTSTLPQAINTNDISGGWCDWLRLQMTPLVGTHTQHKLITLFGSPSAVFAQSTSALQAWVSEPQAQSLLRIPDEWEAVCARTRAWLAQTQTGVKQQVWSWDNPMYPAMLRDIDEPPLLLFAQGQLHLPCWQGVAVVGSRNPTPQGTHNAKRMAHQLQQAGCCVVSGLAMGIDAAAHLGALEVKSPDQCATVAVVGTGLDRVYPKHHHALARQVAQHGWLLSELPPGTPPLPHHFPRRNRLIAGLSHGVLVVEAALKSGSLITADLALSQGKEVFAIPGSIHSVLSRGCHALLKQGAKLVESVQDVLEELPAIHFAAEQHHAPQMQAETLNPQQRYLLNALGHEPQHLEALLIHSGMSLEEALLAMQALMSAGKVAEMPGGLYQQLCG